MEEIQTPGTLEPGVDRDHARRERVGGAKSGAWSGCRQSFGEGKALP